MDLERRCQEAELRHQDLSQKLPEATRPLLRQLDTMRAAAAAAADTWAAAERSLQQRLREAEGRAAAAGEAVTMANQLAQVRGAMRRAKAGGLRTESLTLT